MATTVDVPAIVDGQQQYAAIFRALDTLTDPNKVPEGMSPLRREAADAIRVIALTGARRNEIVGLRWQHVDLKAGTLTLPPRSHKTGRKTGEDRVIGLPAVASAIIARQAEGAPGDESSCQRTRMAEWTYQSLGGRFARSPISRPTLGLHGLRHSLASHMAMEGAEAAEIMATLGRR